MRALKLPFAILAVAVAGAVAACDPQIPLSAPLPQSAPTQQVVASVQATVSGAPAGAGTATTATTATSAVAQTIAGGTTIRYEASDAVLANPERGPVVFLQASGVDPEGTAAPALSEQGVQDYLMREQARTGATTVRIVYSLAAWRGSDLPQDFLDRVAADLAAARTVGFKVFPYFAYNWSMETGPDAPADLIVTHIGQLRPILTSNSDVVAALVAGFIGGWGEWHTSTNGNVTSNQDVNDETRRILDALLAAVPADRAVMLRYAGHKQQLFGSQPMPASQAFDGGPAARLGFHNECFLSSPSDETGPERRGGFHAYLEAEGLAVPQLYALDPDCLSQGQTVTCPEMLDELSRTHVDAMVEPDTDQLLDRQQCLPEVNQRLGYRYRLAEAVVPATGAAGADLPLMLRVANDGWSPAYNERPVELVLRHTGTGAVTRVSLSGSDPRRWQPGQTTDAALSARLPANLAPGDYSVLLALPDPAPSLAGDARYAIRLANAGLWDATVGAHDLKHTMTVTG